jgi:hypothetical protein
VVQAQVYARVVHESGPGEDSVAVCILDGQCLCAYLILNTVCNYVLVYYAVSKAYFLLFKFYIFVKFEGAGGGVRDDLRKVDLYTVFVLRYHFLFYGRAVRYIEETNFIANQS